MQKRNKHAPLRIGIYAGAFDPVHAGHVAFALQSLQVAGLDEVVFLPERRPRYKPGVEHYAHRIAMLKAALALHPKLSVMEVVDRHFTVSRMLPLLQATFQGAQLVFLMGSDTATQLPAWRYAERLVLGSELVVGVRASHDAARVARFISHWSLPAPQDVRIITSYAPDVSSSVIRQALRTNGHAEGLLASVQRYAQREWLYASAVHYGL